MALYRSDPSYGDIATYPGRRRRRLWTPPGTSGPAAPNDFVTRDSATGYLMLNGQRYRFAGTNNGSTSWNMTENATSSNTGYGSPITSSCARPTNFQIEEQIRSAVAMNTTVIRTFSFLMINHPLAVVPTSSFALNEDSLERIDYALHLCRSAGIRVIAPLVDNYTFFMGGRNDWCTFSGVSATAANFYTHATVIANFKSHITNLLAHRNRYNDIRYRDDPTILMWETGNELDTGSGAWVDAYSAWTVDIAQHIKTTAGAQQLVADGKNGIYGQTDLDPDLTVLNSPYVDCFSSHPYRDVNGPDYYMTQAEVATTEYGKAYFIGESTWTDASSSGTNEWKLPEMLSMTLGTKGCSGYCFWETHPPLVNHGDGFALHYPGDDLDMQHRVQQLLDHANLVRNGFIAPITIRGAVAAGVTSANRGGTFSSNYSPKEDDIIIVFGSTTAVRTAGSLDAAWTNLLGTSTVLSSPGHSVAVVARRVTAAEEIAGTLTYTATGVFNSSTSGTQIALALRGVDRNTPLDSVGYLIDTTAALSPHKLAGLTGSDLSNNSQVISYISKATINLYDWTMNTGFLADTNTNQAATLYSRNLPTTAGVNVPELDVAVSTSGDYYISVTLAMSGQGTSMVAPVRRLNYGSLLQV